MTPLQSARLATLAAASLAVFAIANAASATRAARRQDKLSIGVEAEQLGRNRVKITIMRSSRSKLRPAMFFLTSPAGEVLMTVTWSEGSLASSRMISRTRCTPSVTALNPIIGYEKAALIAFLRTL